VVIGGDSYYSDPQVDEQEESVEARRRGRSCLLRPRADRLGGSARPRCLRRRGASSQVVASFFEQNPSFEAELKAERELRVRRTYDGRKKDGKAAGADANNW